MYHRPCVGCGYDLIGLARSGVCPECGRRIADSLGGPRQLDGPPAALRRVRRGAVLVQVCLAGMVVLFCTPVASSALACGVSVGLWMIAAPGMGRPGDGLERSGARARRWALATVASSAAVSVLSWRLIGRPSETLATVGMVLCVLSAVALAGAGWLALGHIRRLADRVPQRAVSRACVWVAPLTPLWASAAMLNLYFINVAEAWRLDRFVPAEALLTLVLAGWGVHIVLLWVIGLLPSIVPSVPDARGRFD